MNRGEDYFSPFLVDLSLPSIVIVRDVARVKTNLYYIIKDISHISHIRESRFSFSLYVHCLLFSKWNKPRPSLAKCLKKTFRGVLLFDCYIYLGLHEKCELAQLALFNITTFYPSETFILKLGENLVLLPRPVQTILVDKLQTSRAETGGYQLGLTVLQQKYFGQMSFRSFFWGDKMSQCHIIQTAHSWLLCCCFRSCNPILYSK